MSHIWVHYISFESEATDEINTNSYKQSEGEATDDSNTCYNNRFEGEATNENILNDFNYSEGEATDKSNYNDLVGEATEISTKPLIKLLLHSIRRWSHQRK